MHRARELRAQTKTRAKIQPHPAEADAHLEENEDGAHQAVVGKLEWELEKTSRDLKGLAVGMLCLFLEDVPMVCVRRRPCANGESASSEPFRCWARQVVLTSLLIFKEDIKDKTVR